MICNRFSLGALTMGKKITGQSAILSGDREIEKIKKSFPDNVKNSGNPEKPLGSLLIANPVSSLLRECM